MRGRQRLLIHCQKFESKLSYEGHMREGQKEAPEQRPPKAAPRRSALDKAPLPPRDAQPRPGPSADCLSLSGSAPPWL